MRRVVVVSNRVPALEGDEIAGGLAVGLHAALGQSRGLWVGWNGRIDDTGPDRLETRDGGAYQLATLGLTQAEHAGYYAGTANRVLWPLLHGRADLIRFDPDDLLNYLAVNDRFARHLVGQLTSRDLVWVHDYHLLALGEGLRRRGVRVPLGFFLHVPFPAPEVVAALPCHRTIIGRLAAYDLIGFQTPADAANFRDYAAHHLGGRVYGDTLVLDGRRVRVGAFPIGIDARRFAELATSARVRELGERMAPALTGGTGIVGVDRLDYTKGLPLRLRAFERLLETSPAWRGRVQMFQVAAPSRETVPEYAALRAELETLSGRINARFADLDRTPLRYMNRTLPQWQLAALYRMAKVGLVTPLADGMNLVAKEYVAAQDPDDPGVLVLSRFAGAAAQLPAALLVDPRDIDGVAATLRRALEMPAAERRARWTDAMASVTGDDIHHWHRGFLDTLAQVDAPDMVRRPAPASPDRRRPDALAPHLLFPRAGGEVIRPTSRHVSVR